MTRTMTTGLYLAVAIQDFERRGFDENNNNETNVKHALMFAMPRNRRLLTQSLSPMVEMLIKGSQAAEEKEGRS